MYHQPAWWREIRRILHKIPYNGLICAKNAGFVTTQNDTARVFLHIKSEPARLRRRALFTHTRRIEK
jgi:hypothetical protein